MGAVERPEITGFTDFDAGHRDLVTVTRFNFYGNRIVTASSDHRMKVWDLKDGQWQLIDTWRAHDAEIRDVRQQTRPTGVCWNQWLKYDTGKLEWTIYRPAHRQCRRRHEVKTLARRRNPATELGTAFQVYLPSDRAGKTSICVT